MTAAAAPDYVATVLMLYIELPDTPMRATHADEAIRSLAYFLSVIAEPLPDWYLDYLRLKLRNAFQ